MKPDIIDKLFRQYYNDALLYTMSLSHNKTVAEDIVSSAFYIALQSSDDSIQNFKAWLLTVCRNEYFDYLRKNSRISDDEISEEVEDECEQPEEVDHFVETAQLGGLLPDKGYLLFRCGAVAELFVYLIYFHSMPSMIFLRDSLDLCRMTFVFDSLLPMTAEISFTGMS